MDIQATFSSVAGGEALRARVLDVVAAAVARAKNHTVGVDIMTFAFTDPDIADALAVAARQPGLTIRLIADWTQRADDGNQQVGRLAELGLESLQVRYKKDQPYVWDPINEQMRWSYRASRGLLHHKTLSVVVDGRPWRLLCGSSNWSAKATGSYENLLLVTDSTAECRDLMSRMTSEFAALWGDDRASLSPIDAQRHYEAIGDAYRQDALAHPESIHGLAPVPTDPAPMHFRRIDSASREPPNEASPQILIAFSARLPHEDKARAGYADVNSRRHIRLCTPSGKVKRAPLTITTLALDVIFRAREGETLEIAMYGLSNRVPEYGALLAAARRGVRLRVLLDGRVGKLAADSLSAVTEREQLDVHVRSGCRMMHQKYVVNLDSATVLTGTANMSTDAAGRHSEHRIRVTGNDALASQFATDFATIWSRVGNSENAGREGETKQSRNYGTNTPNPSARTS